MTKPSSHALLIIDVINSFDFDHGEALLENAKKIIKPIINLKSLCYEHDFPIIYINDHYNLWQADIEKIYRACENDTSSSFLQELRPDDKDYFLIKPKHSAFYGTALNTLLHQLQVSSLILTGLAGNICVLFTANDAYMREFTLTIPEDCIASVSKQDNHYALKMMKNVLKANTSHSTSFNLNNKGEK
ncbi:isochorismatase family cysteine hydrolase [Bacillus sp. 2205SS5-2]|uniref:isochorismatase family cysteine hydrolase n=1 Tax=Bacillus sp. 2205SS5-2 TaxID=3109031 RepID=UPI0030053712